MSTPRLLHLHLPFPSTYAHASRIQERLIQRLLAYKRATTDVTRASTSAISATGHSSSDSAPAAAREDQLELPPATILTFSPRPIYTTGRRDLGSEISVEQRGVLTEALKGTFSDASKRRTRTRTRESRGEAGAKAGAGVDVMDRKQIARAATVKSEQDDDRDVETGDETLVAEVHQSSRGGQITFHGPGQLVIWPVFSLTRPASFPAQTSRARAQSRPGGEEPYSGVHSCASISTSTSTSISTSASSPSSTPLHQTTPSPPPSSPSSSPPPSAPYPLTPRCYISLLEATTIHTLSHYRIPSTRTADPGVWYAPETQRKIAALGVHLRRNVTAFGVGLNVCTDRRWWRRIVACGLVGKGVVSMEEVVGELEGERRRDKDKDKDLAIRQEEAEKAEEEGRVGRETRAVDMSVEAVSRVWVEQFARAVGAEVQVVTEADLGLDLDPDLDLELGSGSARASASASASTSASVSRSRKAG